MSLPISSSPQPGVYKDRMVSGQRTADQRTADQRDPASSGFRALLESAKGADSAGSAASGLLSNTAGVTSDWSGLEGGVEFEAAAQRFNLTLSADNRAVSFEARPIVGPASLDLSATEKAFQDQYQRSPGIGASDAGIRHGLRMPLVPQAGEAGILALSDYPATSPEQGTGTATISQSNATGQGGHPAASSAPAPVLSSPAPSALQRSAEPVAASAPGAASTPQQPHFNAPAGTRAQLLAQLLTTTEEYRVVVRGTTLGRAEELELADAIRWVLRGQGLPDRPIVVSVLDRRG